MRYVTVEDLATFLEQPAITVEELVALDAAMARAEGLVAEELRRRLTRRCGELVAGRLVEDGWGASRG
jgi:hypothetical protein